MRQGQHGGDGFATAEIGQIGEISAPFLRQLMDPEAVAAAGGGEDEELVAGVGCEQGGGRVLGSLAQAGAVDAGEILAAQGAVSAESHPDAAVRQQIGGGEGALGAFDDLCAAAVGVLLAQGEQLFADDAENLAVVGEQVFEVGD